MAATAPVIPENTIPVLDHGFVRLDDAMATDLSVVNAARVSFARRKEEMDDSDAGLIRFLMRERHGCYDDRTDVLTADGWKAWPDVTGEERFATLSRTGALEYQPALRVVHKEFRGHMIGFKGMSLDLLVTPDHRVLASGATTLAGRKSPTFRLQPAHAVLWRSHRHVATATWDAPEPGTWPLDGAALRTVPLMRLLGLFVGDGNLPPSNHVVFNIRKAREIAFLRSACAGLGVDVREWGKALAVPVGPDLRQLFADCYRDREKVIPARVLDLGPRALEGLFEGLIASDGTRMERGAGRAPRDTYVTTSRRLADQVQELALKLGRSATVREHPSTRSVGHFGSKTVWRVTIYAARNTRPGLCRTRADAEEQMGVERYDGSIHCVEVPNGTLYVRRNGTPVWCGNTPFEHNSFRFHVRCPIFVAREWFRHRIGCLTEDTIVTFVNCNGTTGPGLRKTIGELHRMWNEGERDGHALPEEVTTEVRRLFAAGRSQRAIARELRLGRRAVRTVLAGRSPLRDAKWRVRRMRLRVLDEDSGEFVVGHIDDVVDKGVQPVYRLTLADGKELTLTENHRLLTTEGWRTMREAVGLVGDGDAARMTRPAALLTNGVPAHRDAEWLRERRRRGLSVGEIAEEAGCSYHTVRKWLARHDLRVTAEDRRGRRPWNAGMRGYRTGLRHSEQHLAAIRAARSGARSNFWRGGLSSERANVARWTTENAPKVHEQYDYTCQRCQVRGGRLHAHHIVPVWHSASHAREIGNLITLCDACHRAVHRTRESELAFAGAFATHVGFVVDRPVERTRGWKLTARPADVVRVAYVGLRQTYDLCVEGPWHNFVANGVVVHNSFNEFSLRYARATDDFYVPEPDDVRTQVGKPGAYSFEPVADELAERTREEMRAVYDQAYATYERLVEEGVAREIARAVLPVGAYTEFYWTVNARSLMNFVSLRAAETAQREIRRYADAVERFLAERMPITHAAFVANDRTAP